MISEPQVLTAAADLGYLVSGAQLGRIAPPVTGWIGNMKRRESTLQSRPSISVPRRRLGSALVLAGAVIAALGGCEFDSWMDPSVVGRWEDTPAVAPILDRLHVIETPEDDIIATSDVEAEDLIPHRIDYFRCKRYMIDRTKDFRKDPRHAI